MSRSTLSTKFFITNISKFEKSFREKYKTENGKPFKGNVINEITLGVIQQKGLPEVNDVITLIKLGNDIDDKNAEVKLDTWLANEDNKKRGLAGAFCDLCKDICIDLPLNNVFVDAVNKLEDTIAERQNIMNQLSEMVKSLGQLKQSNKESVTDTE